MDTKRTTSFPMPHSLDTTHLVALNFRVPFALRQQLKMQAALLGISMTELGVVAMQLHLERLSRNSIESNRPV